MVSSALKAQISPVMKSIDASSYREMEARVSRLITDEAIEKMIRDTYSLIVPYFAQVSYDQIAKRSKKQHKASNRQWRAQVDVAVDLYGADRITSITGTSRDQALLSIRRSLSEINKEGLGASQAATLMRDNLRRDWGDISLYRSARIARTEIAGASNFGSLVGAKQSSQEFDEPMFKVWLSTRDSRTRRRRGKQRFDHVVSDGEQRELEDPFVKTGEELDYPGDFNGSAGNVIHCRCAVTYEPKEMDESGGVDVLEPETEEEPGLEQQLMALGKARNIKEAQDHFKQIKPDMKDVNLRGCSLETANQSVLAMDRINKAGWNTDRFDKLAPMYTYTPRGRSALAWANRYAGYVEYSSSFKDGKKLIGYGGENFLVKTAKGLELQETWTHEIGHTIFSQHADELLHYSQVSETIRELKSIKRRYVTKVNREKKAAWKRFEAEVDARGLREPGNYSKMEVLRKEIYDEMVYQQDWYISEYAETNVNEFWAEAFSDVLVGANPSQYAKEAYELLKRNPVFTKQ